MRADTVVSVDVRSLLPVRFIANLFEHPDQKFRNRF
jgi:hypothetical protein